MMTPNLCARVHQLNEITVLLRSYQSDQKSTSTLHMKDLLCNI